MKTSRASVAPSTLPILPALSLILAACGPDTAPERAAAWRSDPQAVEWTHYGGDAGGSKYSPLSQIHRGNVARLEVAWTARAQDFPPDMFESGTGIHEGVEAESGTPCAQCHGSSLRFETTPLMRDGTLYLSTPKNRVLALDPASGAERWAHDPGLDIAVDWDEDLMSRGVSYWSDPDAAPGAPCARRILLASLDARLIALDATTGARCRGFGERGEVRLDRDVTLNGQELDVGSYMVTSPPAVLTDVVVVGSAIGDNRRKDVESGVVRAFDARTGALRWAFDPIPRAPDHPAWSAWTPEGARSTGAANVWSIISADLERDLVFLPTGSAAPDFYGGERPGDNRYANSVVALRGSTGEVVWHFQVVRHDLWDYDVASQPLLLTIPRNGQDVPAVAVGTKMGHVFVLHRETGEPLFPVEERPVPASDVPGEAAWPTQPFPVLPRPLHPTQLSPDDAFGVSDEERAFCRDAIAGLRYEGVFTPPSLQGTLMWPGFAGGMNWDGMAWDRERNLLVASVKRFPFQVRLHRRADFEAARREARPGDQFTGQQGTPYGMSRAPLLSPSGIPCTPPPWSTLVAIDLSDGSVRWERPLGTTPNLAHVEGHEAWGGIVFGGPLVTAGGLVFQAGTADDRIRAFDVETGELLWEEALPAGGMAAPMTYRIHGRQYVVVAAGGRAGIGSPGDYIVAFVLPELRR